MLIANRQRTGRIAAVTVVILAILAVPAAVAQNTSPGGSNQAQQMDVSEEELEQFAAALENVQSIRQEMVEDTQGAVADSSLDESRFQELYRADQGGPAPSEGASDQEAAEYDRVMQEIQQIQQQSNQEMVQAVREEGLEVQRFNQIAQAIQQSPDLQQRFQELQS
jgi:hypothetical protein